MKKRGLLLIMFMFLFTTATAHPVHVSVVNIHFEGSTLRMRISTFVDDWETAYFHYHGKPIQLKKPENLESNWFKKYFQASLVVSANKKDNRLGFVTDTIYFNELSMTIEMHAELKETPDSLYIYNAILTDIFTDQTNLLIYSYKGKEKGIRFDYFKHEEVVKLKSK